MLVLAVCCLSLFIVGVDNTVVNLALPAIGRGLHAPVSGLQWTIDAYTLALASLLLASGSIADRVGRRRIFQTGLAGFAVTSLLCSLAPTGGSLIIFRVLQGAAASMLNPAAMSIIATTFTDARGRARAFGVWSGVYGASMAVGPFLGGVCVATAGWRAIFWITIPIAIAAFVLTALFVPESKAARPRGIDPVGQVLVIALLASLTYGIIQAPQAGWGSAPTLAAFTVAGAALIGLLIYEPRCTDPLIEPRLFHSVCFSGATIIAVCGLAAIGGFIFLNTLYLEDVRRYPALLAGLCTLPTAVMTAVFAPLSGRLAAIHGTRLPLLLSGAATTAGALCMTTLDQHTPLGLLLIAYTLFGLGFSMVNAPVTATAVAGMSPAQAGVASAIASASRQVGQALGVAVVGAVLTDGIHGPLRTGLTAASHPGWWIITGCGVTVFALAIAATRRSRVPAVPVVVRGGS